MEAPLNEILAAGMILLSGWKRDRDFVDAMCGSGTLPIEAAMIAKNIPSQWKRKSFGFQKWKHLQDLKMSHQEIRDEQKEDDGDPQVRARIKRLQREEQ